MIETASGATAGRATAVPASAGVPGVTLVANVPAVTAAAMAEIERLAVDEFGISRLQMIELAGSHLAEIIRLEVGGDLRGRSVVVVAGRGTSGASGLAAARHLVNRGASVGVLLAAPALRLAENGRRQLATLLAMGASCRVATYDLSDAELAAAIAAADVVVDALLGSGALEVPRGEVERPAGAIERAGRFVASLDVPTGLDPDTGEAAGVAVRPSATMTLGLPKVGLLAAAGRGRAGRLYLADIGLPAELLAGLGLEIGPLFAASRLVALDPAA